MKTTYFTISFDPVVGLVILPGISRFGIENAFPRPGPDA